MIGEDDRVVRETGRDIEQVDAIVKLQDLPVPAVDRRLALVGVRVDLDLQSTSSNLSGREV